MDRYPKSPATAEELDIAAERRSNQRFVLHSPDIAKRLRQQFAASGHALRTPASRGRRRAAVKPATG